MRNVFFSVATILIGVFVIFSCSGTTLTGAALFVIGAAMVVVGLFDFFSSKP